MVISFRSTSTGTAIVDTLYKDIFRRLINTMANSLIQSQPMLDRIAKDKGVDAEIALRDRLKAYTTDKHTQLAIILLCFQL